LLLIIIEDFMALSFINPKGWNIFLNAERKCLP